MKIGGISKEEVLDTHCRYKDRTSLIWCKEAPHNQKTPAETPRGHRQNKPPSVLVH